MVRSIELAMNFLNKKLLFNEFGLTFEFSLLQVIFACIIISLFFRIFYTLYDR